MKRVAKILACVLLVIGGLVCFALTTTPVSTWVFGMGAGSPEYARRWGTAFRKVSDPESAKASNSDVAFKRFENGEWIFGISLDSHASIRGGTFVLKDSTGRTTTDLIGGRLAQEAKALLRQTDWTLWEIADSLGFVDVAHLSHFFRRYAAVSPGAFRSLEAVSI